MQEVTGERPDLHGTIVGFGSYHYKYASGREGDGPAASLAPRKRAMTTYLMDGVAAHMKKYAAILKPKFDAVDRILGRELGGKGLAEWTRPLGGYFVSLDVVPGTARAVVKLAREIGTKVVTSTHAQTHALKALGARKVATVQPFVADTNAEHEASIRNLGVEPAGQHQLGAVPHHDAEHGVEAVDVEEREYAEHHVVAVDHRRLDRSDLLDVGQQRAVGEHRRPRASRRTAGVEEGGQLLGVLQGRHAVGAVGPEVVEGPLARPGLGPDDDEAGDHESRQEVGLDRALWVVPRPGILEPAHRLARGRHGVRVGDEQPGTRVGDHPGKLAGLRRRVDRHRHGLGAQHREVGGHELDPVAEHHHHPVARHDPGVAQAGGQPTDLVVELAPRDPPASGLDDREPVGVLCRGPGQEVRHVGRRSVGHERILPHGQGG